MSLTAVSTLLGTGWMENPLNDSHFYNTLGTLYVDMASFIYYDFNCDTNY